MSDFVLGNVNLMNGKPVDLIVRSGLIGDIVAPGLARAHTVHDLTGRYVSSGWIDFHVHAFGRWAPYGDAIDEVGIRRGVTTIVDAGSCGADHIDRLFADAATAQTNVFTLLNVSRIGLKRIDELTNPAWLNFTAAQRAVARHRDRIVGLKARISQSVVGDQGIKPLHIARRMADALSLPLTVHIGSAPPPITGILGLLHRNDVITHYLHGKHNGLFNDSGDPLPAFTAALNRGVQLDVGHGSASFSFKTAERARSHRIPLGTVSTDMYRQNRMHGPVYSLAHVMSKFLHLGYTVQQVIDAVTVQPATRLGRPHLGCIKTGDPANLTVFSVVDEPLVMVDSMGEHRTAQQHIRAEGVVTNGQYISC